MTGNARICLKTLGEPNSELMTTSNLGWYLQKHAFHLAMCALQKEILQHSTCFRKLGVSAVGTPEVVAICRVELGPLPLDLEVLENKARQASSHTCNSHHVSPSLRQKQNTFCAVETNDAAGT